MTSQLADSLEAARPEDLVHIDREGRVRSPARYRAITGVYWVTLLGLTGIEGYLGYLLFGAPGLSLGIVIGGALAWVGSRHVLLRRSSTAALSGEVDVAEAMAERVAKGWLVPRSLRAIAYGRLAFCASLRGDPDAMLRHTRESLRLWGKSGNVVARITRYGEVFALTRMGTLDTATDKLEMLGPEPTGDYLRLTHWTTELFLAFRKGAHELDEDVLHERAKHALGITSASPLLALLAWAFEQNGDADMAELLMDEARDRHPGDLLSKRMPELQRWMDGAEAEPVRARVEIEEAEDRMEDQAEDSVDEEMSGLKKKRGA
ncbi:MAG: hypothetical protein EVA89_25525 [Sandaracinaceae bacterium]|nr:MAG: hypothetical protein EVA89_25525 [Sandaracinaceae bacterium]